MTMWLKKEKGEGMRGCWDCGLEDRTAIAEIIDGTCNFGSKGGVRKGHVRDDDDDDDDDGYETDLSARA